MGPSDLPASQGEEMCVGFPSIPWKEPKHKDRKMPSRRSSPFYLEAMCLTASWHNCTCLASPRPLHLGHLVTFST